MTVPVVYSDRRVSVDLLICTATELEGALIAQRIGADDPSIALLRTGVGAVNAAHAVTLFLAQTGARRIVVCGVGGAYPGAGLDIGDVVCAERECYGDLGVESPTGFLDMEALGFPVVQCPTPLYNELPLQLFPAPRRARFVTVNACTGTHRAAVALAARTGGAVENMEGAAIVHVALLHGVAVGEIRGISNLATDRDTSAWRLHDAAAAAQEALLQWIGR